MAEQPGFQREFWRGRRVFLTGHTGFKGAWLSLMLKELGAETWGFALPPSGECLFRAAAVHETLAGSTLADVQSRDAVASALQAAEPEIVLHLAAQALVRPSYVDPVGTYATNVMGTVHVLEAARTCSSVRAVVVVTSDKCYENREWVWGYREDEAMGGYDPYSNSKGCAELVCSAYRRSFFQQGARLGSGRAGNVVGGGDYAEDRLIPDLVRAARGGRETLIRNPGAVRPWQHVLEPLTGYLQLAEALAGPEGPRFADGWNFGPNSGAERTVGEVADAVCRLWGRGARWTRDSAPQPHEATFLKLDSSKARQVLRWRPVWDFDETMTRTLEWYGAAEEGHDMRAMSLSQITQYLQALPSAMRADGQASAASHG